MAIQKGNEWFKQEGVCNVKLEVGSALELEQFADKSFGVVFTDAVLIYISPDEIKHIVKESSSNKRLDMARGCWNSSGCRWSPLRYWSRWVLKKGCYILIAIGLTLICIGAILGTKIEQTVNITELFVPQKQSP